MKKHLFALLLLAFAINSCEDKKTYYYIEVVQEESILGGTVTKEKEAKPIKAADDSSAYVEAYQNFCISTKVNKDMQTSIGKTYSVPKSFKLYNDKGVEISNSIFFADKDKREKEIEERIFSMKNTLKDVVDNSKKENEENFKKTASVDSSKMRELLKSFRQKKDDYSNENMIWYQPKSSPIYANANGIYCYFSTENGVPSNLRFRLQYFADDWLFFKSVRFSIDGKAYEYTPVKKETDSGDGGYIWEWFDESLGETDKELIYALANAKTAKMKLDGRQYYKEKGISQEQLISIKKTVDLYKAMGGQY